MSSVNPAGPRRIGQRGVDPTTVASAAGAERTRANPSASKGSVRATRRFGAWAANRNAAPLTDVATAHAGLLFIAEQIEAGRSEAFLGASFRSLDDLAVATSSAIAAAIESGAVTGADADSFYELQTALSVAYLGEGQFADDAVEILRNAVGSASRSQAERTSIEQPRDEPARVDPSTRTALPVASQRLIKWLEAEPGVLGVDVSQDARYEDVRIVSDAMRVIAAASACNSGIHAGDGDDTLSTSELIERLGRAMPTRPVLTGELGSRALNAARDALGKLMGPTGEDSTAVRSIATATYGRLQAVLRPEMRDRPGSEAGFAR